MDEQNQQESDGLNLLREQLAGETERANRLEGRLKSHIIESALERGARRARAYNNAQVVAILRSRASAVPTKDGQFDVVVDGNGEQLTIQQAIEGLKVSDPNFFFSPADLKSDNAEREGETPTERAARLAKHSPEQYRLEREALLRLRPRRNNR